MPRLPLSLLRLAYTRHPLLPTLLKECRTLPQASSELRWLREFAQEHKRDLQELCKRRGRGEPLQYILGSQPVGELDILCRRGVLIPRQETEHLVSRLFSRLTLGLSKYHSCRILDLCTGTGCIPLHLYSLLSSKRLPARCMGVDVSPLAIALARKNLRYNIKTGVLPPAAGEDVSFVEGNVLDVDRLVATVQRSFGGYVDVVVSNPPYIDPRSFDTETARSVRNYEPRLALVPEGDGGDAFYPVVAEIAGRLGARVVMVEVGGWAQAKRVSEGLEKGEWESVEVWADYGGKGRGVVAWREAWEWFEDALGGQKGEHWRDFF